MPSKDIPTIFEQLLISRGGDKNPDIRLLVENYYREWELIVSDFWYFANNFIYTFDEENETERPFPDFDYLHMVHEQVESSQETFFLKSRRLLITWYGTVRMFRRAFIAGSVPSAPQIFKGAFMTVGELECKELIERVQFMYDRLPEWQKAINPMVTDNKMLIEFKGGGSIKAFPLKREGPRSFGFTEVFFDEMAFQEAVRSVYTGMAPTLGAKGKLIAVSTPNGRGNLFHDIWSNRNKQYESINRVTIEWSENPEHDDKWFKQVCKKMDKRMIAREFGLSFASPAGEPVFLEADRETHVLKEEPEIIDDEIIFIWWDFGYHYPAATIWQVNGRDQFVGYAELQGYDVDFNKFASRVLILCNSLYDRDKHKELHAVDPAGKQRFHTKGTSGAVNDIGEIRAVFGRGSTDTTVQVRFGAQQVGTRNNEGPRIKAVRKALKLRGDGNPGLVCSPRMVLFIEGLMGAYCYPEKGGEEPEKGEPSHLQDTAQYGITVYNRMVRPKDFDKEHKAKRYEKYKPSKFRTGLS